MKKRNFLFFFLFLIFLCFFLFFYFKNKEIRELNKNLPQGVYFEKRGKELFLINKLDGYELKIPESWGNIGDVKYIDQGEIFLSSKTTEKWISIKRYFLKEKNIDFKKWVKSQIQKNFGKELISSSSLKIETFTYDDLFLVKVILTFPSYLPGSDKGFFYFIHKNSVVYEFYTDISDDLLKEIFSNFFLK